MSSELLKKAIELSKAGENKDAQDLLRNILREDSRDELAWIWFAGIMPTVDGRLRTLERGLKINLESQRLVRAIHALQRIKDEVTRIKALSSSAADHSVGSISRLRGEPRVEHLAPPPETSQAKAGKKKFIRQLLTSIFTIVALWRFILWVGCLVGADDSNAFETLLFKNLKLWILPEGLTLQSLVGP